MKLQTPRQLRITGLFLMLFCFGFLSLKAQDDEERKAKISGGYGYFTPGYAMLDLSSMNNYLGVGNFGDFSDNSITLGGGGFMVVRNIVLGGEGHGFLNKNATSATQEASLEGGWGLFQLGYVVFSKKGFLIYPKAGIGGYNHRLTIVDAGGNPDVSQVLNSDYPGTQIVRKGMLLSGGIGVDFMPGFDEFAGSGIVIGLGVNYNYVATQGSWEAYEQTLTGGPGIDMSGLVFTLRIGGGGWHRQ